MISYSIYVKHFNWKRKIIHYYFLFIIHYCFALESEAWHLFFCTKMLAGPVYFQCDDQNAALNTKTGVVCSFFQIHFRIKLLLKVGFSQYRYNHCKCFLSVSKVISKMCVQSQISMLSYYSSIILYYHLIKLQIINQYLYYQT